MCRPNRLVPAHIPCRLSHIPHFRKILASFLLTQAMIAIQVYFIDGRIIYNYFRILLHFTPSAQRCSCALPCRFSILFYAEKDKKTLYFP